MYSSSIILLYLLYNPETDKQEIKYGNNTVLTTEVDNINEALELVKNLNSKIVMPLEEIDGFKIFQIEDTEGNVIEFYQKIKEK